MTHSFFWGILFTELAMSENEEFLFWGILFQSQTVLKWGPCERQLACHQSFCSAQCIITCWCCFEVLYAREAVSSSSLAVSAWSHLWSFTALLSLWIKEATLHCKSITLEWRTWWELQTIPNESKPLTMKCHFMTSFRLVWQEMSDRM